MAPHNGLLQYLAVVLAIFALLACTIGPFTIIVDEGAPRGERRALRLIGWTAVACIAWRCWPTIENVLRMLGPAT
jgi:hypothetical protein